MLVSCIMPTRNRPAFARHALDCFLSQDHSDRELIIVDDSDAPSFAEKPQYPNVEYVRVDKMRLGAKRNLAINIGRGEVIAHFDDDDHSEPGRLTDQLTRLLESGKQLTGYHSMRFLNDETGEWWHYRNKWTGFALGTSLMYRREFWERHRFPVLTMGEDAILLGHAMRKHTVVTADANGLMWARKHAANTARKTLRGSFWTYEGMEAA